MYTTNYRDQVTPRLFFRYSPSLFNCIIRSATKLTEARCHSRGSPNERRSNEIYDQIENVSCPNFTVNCGDNVGQLIARDISISNYSCTSYCVRIDLEL